MEIYLPKSDINLWLKETKVFQIYKKLRDLSADSHTHIYPRFPVIYVSPPIRAALVGCLQES